LSDYVRERLAALLEKALASARAGNETEAQKLLALVEDFMKVEVSSTDVSQIIGKYAASFRSMRRSAEAERLDTLAKRLRAYSTERYYPDGTPIPWFKQQKFLATIPPLPIELKPSRADDTYGCGCTSGVGIVFVAGLVVTLPLSWLLPDPPRLLTDTIMLVWIVAAVIAGVITHRRRAIELKRNATESWCRVTEAGLQFKAPDEMYDFKWNEISAIVVEYESGTNEDDSRPALIVTSGARKFRMSSRFYTEEEVRMVEGIARLKTGN